MCTYTIRDYHVCHALTEKFIRASIKRCLVFVLQDLPTRIFFKLTPVHFTLYLKFKHSLHPLNMHSILNMYNFKRLPDIGIQQNLQFWSPSLVNHVSSNFYCTVKPHYNGLNYNVYLVIRYHYIWSRVTHHCIGYNKPWI